MTFLLRLARGLNAAYRIAFVVWLFYCLIIQIKHRREIIRRRGGEMLPHSSRLH